MTEQNYNTNETNATNNTTGHNANHAFSFLYRTRIKVNKGETSILNLSLIFSIISLLCAPWLVIGGLIVALVMGYRFSFEKNSKDFSGDFQEVVNNAAGNVKTVVDSVFKDDQE